MKIVINKCYGGFGLSQKAYNWLRENKGWRTIEKNGSDLYHKDCLKLMDEGYSFYSNPIPKVNYWDKELTYLGNERGMEFRSNPDVVDCVEKLGKLADGGFAELKIVECDRPVDEIEIHEYDGYETLQTIPEVFG